MRLALLVPLLALCHCAGSGSASGGDGGSTTDATTAGDGAGDGTASADAPASADAGDSATARGDSGTADAADAGGDTSSSATSDAASCGDTFLASLNKMCSMDSECTTADHSDCCGTVVTGIRVGTQTTFANAEQAFMACEPGCGARGCFHANWAESGQPSADAGTIVVHCDAGACTTRFQ